MDSPGALIAARAVMGVGRGDGVPRDAVAAHQRVHRAAASARWRSACGARSRARRSRSGRSSAAGCSSVSDWRSIFFAMAPVAAIAGVLVAGYVPTSRDPRAPRTDRAGFALSTATIGLLVYTIIEAPEPRLGQRADARRLRADGGAGGGVRGLGAAHRAADARREPVPQPALHRRQRIGRDLVLRAVRVHLPGHPVLPVPQGLRPAVDRRAPAAGRHHASRSPRSSAPSSPCGSARSWSSRPGCSRWPRSTCGSRPHRPPPATATIAAQMVVLGTGMGLTSAPATEAIMGVVPEGEGRRRVGGQRRHAAARRHPRRRGDRQRLRLAVRQPAHRARSPRGLPATVARDRARIRRRRAHRRRRAGPRRPSGARGGRPQRRQLGLLPRLPRGQLRRRRRRRRRRPDGAGTAARPPHHQHRRHARYTSTVSPATVSAPSGL